MWLVLTWRILVVDVHPYADGAVDGGKGLHDARVGGVAGAGDGEDGLGVEEGLAAEGEAPGGLAVQEAVRSDVEAPVGLAEGQEVIAPVVG